MKGLFRDASLLALGGAVYGAGQWFLLAWLTRAGGLAIAGDYAFILAVANPVFLVLGLSLREVLATDAPFRRDFNALLGVRLLTLMLAGLGLSIAVLLSDLSRPLALAVIGLKMIEAISDISYGAMQRRGAAGAAGASFMLRVGGGALAAIALILLDQPMITVLAGIGVAWVVVLGLFDLPKTRRPGDDRLRPRLPDRALLKPLVAFALPLTFTAALTAFAYNTPRYALKAMSDAVELGVFSALSSFALLGQVLTAGVAAAALGRLSAAAHGGDRRTFLRILGVISAGCALVGLGLWAGAIIAGQPVLNVAFGAETAARSSLLPGLILFYLPVFISQPLSFAAIALGQRRAALAGSAAWAILGLLAGLALIPAWGLMGAGAGLCLGALAQNAVTLFTVLRTLPEKGDF